MNTRFTSLPLHPSLLDNLPSLGYDKMTAIQEQSLPLMLEGKDVIAQGKTGSGKTAAFGLSLLNRLDVKRFRVQSLVLCPTRELADQVAKEIRRLARAIHNIKVLTLCGGAPFGPQIGSLQHGAHIVVGTPGRVEEHLRKGNLSLQSLQTLVLDEADRMLDMGFQAALDAIIEHVPTRRQTLLFSATYPPQIQTIAEKVMHSPERVTVASTHDASSIDQQFYCVSDHSQRIEALSLLLLHHRPDAAVVFCNTKKETQEVADALSDIGFCALALHGDLEQKMRDQILVRFANKSASILVATDVAARGLDIDNVNAVFNYQLSREVDVHIHRIGRTGRAQQKGAAYTIYTEKEQYKIETLEQHLTTSLAPTPLPALDIHKTPAYKPAMKTVQIAAGKKQKLRPGDILGALTANGDLQGADIGKIHIFDHCAYVAVVSKEARHALSKLQNGKLKGRSFRARII